MLPYRLEITVRNTKKKGTHTPLQHNCTAIQSHERREITHAVQTVVHIFLAPYQTRCAGKQILIGHGALIMQKQLDTRLVENKIRGCEQNSKR